MPKWFCYIIALSLQTSYPDKHDFIVWTTNGSLYHRGGVGDSVMHDIWCLVMGGEGDKGNTILIYRYFTVDTFTLSTFIYLKKSKKQIAGDLMSFSLIFS